MDYPTEEEEFELMYGDELNMMDDGMLNVAAPPKTPQQLPRIASTQMSASNRPPSAMSLLQSPALSQISRDGLIYTPGPNGTKRPSKFASTPFAPSQPIHEKDPSASSSQQHPQHIALNEIQNFAFNSRKRRLEDLFGDIYDIEEEDAVAKKCKSEEERDMEVIEKILEARKRFMEQLNPMKHSNLDKLEAFHKFKMENLSYCVPKWPFLTIKKNDDDRIYVRFHSEEFEAKKLNELKCFNNETSSLLGAEKTAIWEDAREIVLKGMINHQAVSKMTEAIEDVVATAVTQDDKLWVDKYKPKKYVDLLSDETTNRSLLQWIKLWDKVVFNQEVKKKLDKKAGPLSSFNKKTGKFEQTGGWVRRQKHNLNTDLDEHHRPVQKIALLCGPPGLGKTTLAHTLAKHAGYAPREINASDDRSPEAFRQALENGTQMSSVLNQDKKPNCIILDEIDGAPLASIDFLLKFASGLTKEKSKKGVNQKPVLLNRPIICICNDMYGASLRQLRQVAFIVNFPKIESGRLAERLQIIAERERVRTDLTAMLALAEKTGNDIRSCLGMLQFFGGSDKPLTLIDVLRSNIGKKDIHQGLFGVWQAIFQVQRPRKTIKVSTEAGKNVVSMTDMSQTTRMRHVLDIVHMAGDYEKLTQGVYENYLKQKMPDPNMDGVVEAANWFCFNDLLQNKINHLQNYSVYPYLSFGFVSWHFLFASMAFPKLTYPSKSYEVFQKTNASKIVFQTLRKGIVASLKGAGDGPAFLLDSLSLIKCILCPILRSVSVQLLTPKEKADLMHVVAVMADLGLAYTQLKSMDGTYVYQLTPDIEHLSSFDGISAPTLNYWTKQLIAREVDVEHMRRTRPKTNETSALKKAIPNFLQKLQPKSIHSTSSKRVFETVSKDFFGRLSTKTVTLEIGEVAEIGDGLVKSPIWFKYKVGFNNAVRKDVMYGDLL